MAETERPVRLRILLLIPELGYGGAERSLINLSRFLLVYHDVSIAVFKRQYAKGGYAPVDENIKIPLTILDEEGVNGRFERWLIRWKKVRNLKQHNDVTISFLTGTNLLNVMSGGPGYSVISVRGSRLYDPNLTAMSRLIYQYFIDPLMYMVADRVITISEGLSKEIGKQLLKSARKKIETIELFVDSDELVSRAHDEIEEEVERLKGQPVIITAGRLSQEKGFQYLIPIFAGVHRINPDVKLVIIGDGPLHNHLIEICNNLNLKVGQGVERLQESAVIFLGYRKNPHRYFRIARLFVQSSLTEGFSNIVLEALAAGVPVLAADCPWGPRSILWKEPRNVERPYPTLEPTDADYGVLMPRIDVPLFHEKWVEKISEMLSKPKNEHDAARIGRKRVREFDSNSIGQKWISLLERLGLSRN